MAEKGLTITDPDTGRSITWTAPEPPTEEELGRIWAQLPPENAAERATRLGIEGAKVDTEVQRLTKDNVFTNTLGENVGGALTGAGNRAWDVAKGFLPGMANLAADLYQRPLDTVTGVAKAMYDEPLRIGRQLGEGTSDAVGRSIVDTAMLLPGVIGAARVAPTVGRGAVAVAKNPVVQGAVLGGATGAMTGGVKGAAIGAVTGATGGGLGGRVMDVLEGLRQPKATPPVPPVVPPVVPNAGGVLQRTPIQQGIEAGLAQARTPTPGVVSGPPVQPTPGLGYRVPPQAEQAAAAMRARRAAPAPAPAPTPTPVPVEAPPPVTPTGKPPLPDGFVDATDTYLNKPGVTEAAAEMLGEVPFELPSYGRATSPRVQSLTQPADGLAEEIAARRGPTPGRRRSDNRDAGTTPVAPDLGADAMEVLAGEPLPQPTTAPRPAALPTGLQGEEGFVYHVTNTDRLGEIASSGKLKVHKPSEFTDQSVWPDGAVEKRAYFGESPEHLGAFAPEEGQAAVLRMKRTPGIKRESTGDLYSQQPVDARQLEFLGDDKAWHPVVPEAAADLAQELQSRAGPVPAGAPRPGLRDTVTPASAAPFDPRGPVTRVPMGVSGDEYAGIKPFDKNNVLTAEEVGAEAEFWEEMIRRQQ